MTATSTTRRTRASISIVVLAGRASRGRPGGYLNGFLNCSGTTQFESEL